MTRLSLKPVARASGVAVGLVLAGLLAGCDLDNYPSDLQYGLRTDVIYPDSLIKDLNKKQPTQIDLPGVFPNILARLDSPEVAKALNPAKISAEGRQNLLQELTNLFGTPAQPTVGGVDDSVVTTLRLEPERLAHGSRVYRQQCLHCHGLTGNGRGPTAPWINPHPRDFRLGRFKFTSSSQDEGDRKPRREDLLRTLRMGIEGSAMPAFGILPEDDLEAMVSYVTHLSLRGEVETNVMMDLFIEDIKGDSASVAEGVAVYLKKASGNWMAAESKAIIPGPYPNVDTPEKRKKSVQHGFALFNSKGEAGCIGCHLDYGRQYNYTYDAWGTITTPMNLTLGVYRGGRRPLDLYYRVHSGINGSGMTAFGKALKPEDIWDLVNFMQIMPYEGMRKEYDVQLNRTN
jgi:mono/diheme cytochrome c family protein